jgi:hypothetical protein
LSFLSCKDWFPNHLKWCKIFKETDWLVDLFYVQLLQVFMLSLVACQNTPGQRLEAFGLKSRPISSYFFHIIISKFFNNLICWISFLCFFYLNYKYNKTYHPSFCVYLYVFFCFVILFKILYMIYCFIYL